MEKRTSIVRVLGEGLLIMVSVLVALSADAWGQSRQDEFRRAGHLVSLERDFELMAERVDSSVAVAQRASDAGLSLLEGLSRGAPPPPELAPAILADLFFFEVFSPSTGAYDAVVASGDFELIDDRQLSRELATFFGSFEDLRVSEEGLLNSMLGVVQMEGFESLIGYHRILSGYWDQLPKFGPMPVEEWPRSDLLLSIVALVTVNHLTVLEDYGFLRARIDEILGHLDELRGSEQRT